MRTIDEPVLMEQPRTADAFPWLSAVAYLVAAIATIAPLWSVHYLPIVDIPQHLHAINALGHLDDESTLYPQVFERRREASPYLTYYYSVLWLANFCDLFTANAVFLSLVAIGTSLATGALARRLGGSFWQGILALPLFYGDNFYWGFLSYATSLPLMLFALAACIDVLDEPQRVRSIASEVKLSLLLLAVQATHGIAFCFILAVLPPMILLTPGDCRRRVRAAAAALPSIAVFAYWLLHKPSTALATGALRLTYENTPFGNLGRTGKLLANGFRDHGDRPILLWLAILAALTFALGWSFQRSPRPKRMRLRGPMLAAMALLAYMALPMNIEGVASVVNTRFAVVFALLAIASLPFPENPAARRTIILAAAAMCCWYGATLASEFRRFDREASDMNTIIASVGTRPRLVSLIYDRQGQVAEHCVYLHFTCYAALARGGITSYSFAETTFNPLKYKAEKPPSFFEFRPDRFDYAAYGRFYDYYLVRGRVAPKEIFGDAIREVRRVARAGEFSLYTRR